MSETSETKGRCRREMAAAFDGTGFTANKEIWLLADGIDRLAADVAAVKEATLPQTTEERDCAIRERDEARAEAERLKAELAARPAATGWLTADDCWQLRVAAEHLKRLGSDACVKTIEGLLARAGSPPVVEVPAMCPSAYGYDSPFHDANYRAAHSRACAAHRAALDKAGVQWKEVPRE